MPYMMFSTVHYVYIALCAVGIVLALRLSGRIGEKGVRETIRVCTLLMWFLELLKTVFCFLTGNADSPNSYLPLYFCSIPLYCGLLSGYGRGIWKRIGDVFLVVGGITGGVVYILSPCTTAGSYPALHFITLQSFIHHSIMIYLGVLMIEHRYIELNPRDIRFYALTVVTMSIIAYMVNEILDTNLMFVSQNNPGTVVELVYNMPGWFSLNITLLQAVPPFPVIYVLVKKLNNKKADKYVA